MDYSKLVLFDIDGTLIQHIGESHFSKRVRAAAKSAYNVEVSELDVANFHGSVDKDTSWSILKESGISYDTFEKHFETYSNSMYDYLVAAASGGSLYKKIADAETLAWKVKNTPHIALGLLTGNVKRIGYWKLEHAGLGGIFSWGVFGDEANDRIELAKMVPHEAHVEFKVPFRPDQIYVIGDTIYDVRCAKSVGAHCIAVTTGRHVSRAELEAETPDLVVDSLMDEQVIRMLF